MATATKSGSAVACNRRARQHERDAAEEAASMVEAARELVEHANEALAAALAVQDAVDVARRIDPKDDPQDIARAWMAIRSSDGTPNIASVRAERACVSMREHNQRLAGYVFATFEERNRIANPW